MPSGLKVLSPNSRSPLLDDAAYGVVPSTGGNLLNIWHEGMM